jgi:hypothetical protein
MLAIVAGERGGTALKYEDGGVEWAALGFMSGAKSTLWLAGVPILEESEWPRPPSM